MTLRRFSAAISAPLHGLALMLAALLGGVSASRAADPVPPPSVALEADPAIVRRTLANGLQVVVLPNANPPGQALVRLVVSAGSRSEAPSEVGASYLAARLLLARARETPAGARAASIPGVFNPPQESDPIVQSNSDLASVTLAVPTADASDLAAVFSFLAEFLRVGALDADTVTRLRPQVQADAAQSESKSDRLRRVVAPVLAPGTTLTTNPSFPRVDRLCEVESDTVTRFVERCYAPIAATLFVVGDADPAAVAALAERELTPVPSTPAEPPARLTLSPRTQPGVVVVSDPDASSFYAELIVPTPAIGALRTAADLRRQLTMELLGIVLDRRMSALLGEREPAVLEVNAWSGDVSSSMFVSVATAVGNAPNWAAIGARVVGVARTLAQGGVTPEERSVAADSLLSRLARDASGVVPSGRLLKSLTRAETLGGLALAPVQLEAAARRVVPAISADDLSRAAAERCDPSIGTLVLVFPPAVPTPSESEARALFAAPLVSPAPAQPRVLPVAHEEPDKPGPDAQGLPGGVAEVTVSPETGVTSAWLTNGIRLHYREVRGTSAGASVAISLVGGRSLEDEGTRGLTLASAALWSTPAFVGTAASGVRKSMTDLSLRLSYLIEPDRVLLEFGVGGESLEAALSLMANLLDQPVIESQSFERWSTSEQRRSQALARSSTGVITTRLEQMLFRPDDPRFGSLSAQESSALKLPNAQAWVEQLCGGPIEIGIAGELRSSVALEIVARTLGQITPRERPQPDRLPLDAPRFLVPQGSPEAKIELGRPGDPAGVMIAIPGADEWNTGAMAHMTIIARALQGTLNQRCTVDRSLAQRVFVQHAPGAGVPGSGLLAVWGICEPGLASLLADEINANLDRMIAEGPNAVELEAARAAALDELDQFFADTRYWARVLSDRTFRVRPLDEPRRLRELIEATPARIAGATLAGLAAQAPRIRIISTPPAPR